MGVALMRRFCVLFLVAGTASCASSSSRGPDVAPPSERTVAVDDQQVYRTTVIANAKAAVPAAPNRTFDAVKAVYEDLGVPPGTHDPTTGRFGNTDFWKSRRFANEPMSTFLNCGESFTGPVANNYRIYISLMSIVRPDGKGGSELETAFSAAAQNMEGSSGDRIACGSTGKLEERIRKSVLLKVGASGQ
jgi:hypothetical protein